MNITPVSELLGSSKEETQKVREELKLSFPSFKGIMIPLEFTYVPLEEEVKHLCLKCWDKPTYKEVTDSDPFYVRYLCTPCMDKAANPKKKKAKPPLKYVRYAGHKGHPSYTLTEYEKLLQEIENEQNRRNANGESVNPVESTPGTTEENGTVNNPIGE